VTFRRLLDRRVTIRNRVVTGKNARHDDVLEDGITLEDVPAGRELESSDEQQADRDSVDRRFVYFLPARFAGAPLAIDAHALIVDGDDVFEVDGEPEVVVRRRGGRAHHVELFAKRQA